MPRRINNYLFRYRKQSGLTQQDLSFLLGSSNLRSNKAYWIERGVRDPNFEDVFLCEKIFRVPAQKLFPGVYRKVAHDIALRARVLSKDLPKGACHLLAHPPDETPIRIVVALYPSREGVGFAVCQDGRLLVEWGVKRVAKHDRVSYLRRIERELLDAYRPDAVVVRSLDDAKMDYPRLTLLIDDIARLSTERRIACQRYSRKDVCASFSHHGAKTKHEIARAIAKQLPELEVEFPRYRQNFMHEHYRMYIFDAAALALTFFDREQNSPSVYEVREVAGVYIANDAAILPIRLHVADEWSGVFV